MRLDTIYTGDALDILKTFPDRSIHTCITSPPYFGLRDYRVKGQIGLEKTSQDYIRKIVEVFHEVIRVLRDDGTLWLNIGDSYASGKGTCFNPGGGPSSLGRQRKAAGAHPLDRGNISTLTLSSLKPKDLLGIPWRIAFTLQKDGWYLRSDIIWHKPNPMPESVTDRCTRAHEYVFMLAKSRRYFFDSEAVKEPCASGASDIRKMIEGKNRIGGKHKELIDPFSKASSTTNIGRRRGVGSPVGRNLRSVWTIATEPFAGAHFATFPKRLIQPMIMAGTSEKGRCPECGAPWERIVKKCGAVQQRWKPGASIINAQYGSVGKSSVLATGLTALKRTTGWKPTCNHRLNPIPCVVLDPFMGAGTTAVVAKKLDRHFVGIELNPEYVRIARRRIKRELSMEREYRAAA